MVTWTLPAGVDFSSYNLRHTRSDASDKSDSSWEVSTVSATPYPGPMSYWLDDLEPSTAYDVQVQAVNSAGPSAWSATVSASTGQGLTISRVSCSPSRPVTGESISCSPTVTGGVRSDDSYAWWAPGATTVTGSGPSFATSWDSTGTKTVSVEVCSAGSCDTRENRIIVVSPAPRLIWDYTTPPEEVPLGEPFYLELEVSNLSWTGDTGGIVVSFPSLTNPNSGSSPSSYESGQGSVVTAAYSGLPARVAYRDSGSTQLVENVDGSQPRPGHLMVETEDILERIFFYRPTRTLRLKVTPNEVGEFRILYRFWLCDRGDRHCDLKPDPNGNGGTVTDQQGHAAFEFTVNVLRKPVINSVVCTPSPALTGQAVGCSPVLGGGLPSTYAWNAGNAFAGGSPFEGSDVTFSTTWDYAGWNPLALEVCNVARCDERRTLVTTNSGGSPIPVPEDVQTITEG